MKFTNNNLGIVLGLNETGLAVGRSLGRVGIKVHGFHYTKDIGFYSKYINAHLCPHPLKNEIKFINFLIEIGKSKDVKPVLFIAADDFLITIAKNNKALSEFFLLNLPKHDLIKSLSDKLAQYKLAKDAQIAMPNTYHFKDISEIKKIKYQLQFPMILKAREVNEWRSVLGAKKAILVCSYDELVQEIKVLYRKGLSPLCQEVIPGPDINHFKYCAYYKDNKEYAAFTLQKIRQYPINFGMGCSVVSTENKDLMEIGKKFFTNVNYNGIGSAEFKWDEIDEEFKLIELNARYWLQNSLPTKCGINFPLIDYLLQTGNKVDPIKKFKSNIKWINIYFDFGSFMDYRKKGQLSLFKWIKSIKGKKVWSDFSWDDPIPGFHHIGFGKRFLEIPSYLIRKIKR